MDMVLFNPHVKHHSMITEKPTSLPLINLLPFDSCFGSAVQELLV